MTAMRLKTANWYIKLFLAILFAGIIVWYTYLQSHNFLEGPLITIDTPASGGIVTEPLVNIRGSAEHVSAISLNASCSPRGPISSR